MRRTISPSQAWGRTLLIGFGLIAMGQGTTSAQGVFDPYAPYSSDYASSSYPTLPNNLALPGSAREASAYATPGGGVSRYNSYQSYLNSEDSGSTRGLPGVPYFQTARSFDGPGMRGKAVYREGDRKFEEYEAERNRRYLAAMKEKDPAKRATMLRALSRMQMPRAGAPKPAEASKTMKPATPPRNSSNRLEAIAGEGLAGVDVNTPPGSTSSVGLTPPVRVPSVSPLDPRNANPTTGVTLPGRRPRLPGETSTTPRSSTSPAR